MRYASGLFKVFHRLHRNDELKAPVLDCHWCNRLFSDMAGAFGQKVE